jgi:hypothetical protein
VSAYLGRLGGGYGAAQPKTLAMRYVPRPGRASRLSAALRAKRQLFGSHAAARASSGNGCDDALASAPTRPQPPPATAVMVAAVVIIVTANKIKWGGPRDQLPGARSTLTSSGAHDGVVTPRRPARNADLPLA